MSRSEWKYSYSFDTNISNHEKKKLTYKTQSRNMVITSQYLNYTIFIYTGIIFKKILIEQNMLGHKLGEFAPTRVKPNFQKKLKKKLIKNKR